MPDLFNSGTLDMPVAPLEHAAAVIPWSGVTVNRIAVLVLIVLVLVSLKDVLLIFPSLLRCVPLWKGNLELEHSVSMARTRGWVALLAGIVFSVIADRYALLNPLWKEAAGPEWGIAITAALLLGTALLRDIIVLVTPMRSSNSEFAGCVRHSVYNYFILMVSLALVSALLCEAFRVPDSAARTVILVEVVMFYLLHLLRYGQILRFRCGIFATFLYLCALEILPLGILVLTCTR